MIEFDASKVVIEVNGVQVTDFASSDSFTIDRKKEEKVMAQPTDTEMLDFMTNNCGSVWVSNDKKRCQYVKGYYWSDVYPTPRAAIAAEMAKEEK